MRYTPRERTHPGLYRRIGTREPSATDCSSSRKITPRWENSIPR